MLQTLLCKGITKRDIENFSALLKPLNMHESPIMCCAFNIKEKTLYL